MEKIEFKKTADRYEINGAASDYARKQKINLGKDFKEIKIVSNVKLVVDDSVVNQMQVTMGENAPKGAVLVVSVEETDTRATIKIESPVPDGIEAVLCLPDVIPCDFMYIECWSDFTYNSRAKMEDVSFIQVFSKGDVNIKKINIPILHLSVCGDISLNPILHQDLSIKATVEGKMRIELERVTSFSKEGSRCCCTMRKRNAGDKAWDNYIMLVECHMMSGMDPDLELRGCS